MGILLMRCADTGAAVGPEDTRTFCSCAVQTLALLGPGMDPQWKAAAATQPLQQKAKRDPGPFLGTMFLRPCVWQGGGRPDSCSRELATPTASNLFD